MTRPADLGAARRRELAEMARNRLSPTDVRRLQEYEELPGDLFEKVLDGSMTPRQARAELEASREQRQAANQMIRDEAARVGSRTFGDEPEEPGPARDPETGRFTSAGQPPSDQ